eukprot:CAMPEP_0202703552 /NCGR_PEP_ID=MMETSP1385-20130828/16385_1 /ASSEMBLY_ACC=CAM_ASM_000861 /TAXON_ID=933848 /ORGANISM="Elphidium margaritaceum" /LENGTH=593 /DNA_ID=CAMNT_0049361427 /DNA_START=22 /DNA_END=1803 /DNA_ORIENTATION=-
MSSSPSSPKDVVFDGKICRDKDNGFNIKDTFCLAKKNCQRQWYTDRAKLNVAEGTTCTVSTGSFWNKLCSCLRSPLPFNPGVQIDFRDWREGCDCVKGVQDNILQTDFVMAPESNTIEFNVDTHTLLFEFRENLEKIDTENQFLVVQVLDYEPERVSKDRVIGEALLTFKGFDSSAGVVNYGSCDIFDAVAGTHCGTVLLNARLLQVDAGAAATTGSVIISKIQITVERIIDLKDPNGSMVKDDQQMVRRDVIALIAWLLYMCLSIVLYVTVEEFAFIDALYLRIVTAFTVGYGDFYPVTNAMKLTNCVFIIVDTVTIGFITSKITNYILRFREIQKERKENIEREQARSLQKQHDAIEREKKERKASVVGGAGGVREEQKEQEQEEKETSAMMDDERDVNNITQQITQQIVSQSQQTAKDASNYWAKHKLWILGVVIVAFIVVGTIFMVYVEGQDFASAFEWNFVTLSTVGYGDVTPATSEGKVFTIFYIIFGVSLVVYFGAAIFERIDADRQEKFKQQVMRRALISEAQLLEFDLNRDGKIDKYEFLSKMLVETQEVEQAKIDEIMRKFEMLDIDKSGTITTEELEQMEGR